MLVCYLDDSGKDAANPITTLAGYAASDVKWKAFETEVEPWFTEFGIKSLHTKDLHHTTGDFKDTKVWTVLHKQAFVSRLCQVMGRHLPLAVSFSVVKEDHKKGQQITSEKRKHSPYAYCFNMIVSWLLEDLRVARTAHTEGLALILEAGHENNAETEIIFNEMREKFDLGKVLRSISFVGKDDSRAIQMADLLAFYSRRRGVAQLKAPKSKRSTLPLNDMEKLISQAVPNRNYVGMSFSDEEPPAPTLAEWRVSKAPNPRTARGSSILVPKKRIIVRRKLK